MESWKEKLYEGYVTTGQAASNVKSQTLNISDYPRYLEYINKYISKDKNINILELACGHGAFLYCLKEKGYVNVSGVDVSSEQIGLAKDLGIKNVNCSSMEDYLEKSSEKYDLIILMDILEHIEKPDLLPLLEQIRNRLHQEGSLLIHVPNAEGIFGMRIRYGDFTHTSCFTSKSITQVLKACQFSEIRCYEEQPTIHGVKSLIRYVLWNTLVLPYRLLLASETGALKHILSQNMLVSCQRDD